MSSSERSLAPIDADSYLRALLAAPRPGAEKLLAFYDHRVGCIGTDPRLLLAPLDDHLCHRGDGIFESMAWRERRILALERHMERLSSGAQALSLRPPCSWDEVRRRILDVARASGCDCGDLRVFLSRGPGGFGVSPAECPEAGFYVVGVAQKPTPQAVYDTGLSAFTSEIPPKQEYLARIKNTNYLPNVLMAEEARQKGMDVAVTFDEKGFLGEAAVASVAIVDSGGRLRSPDFARILPGTTLLAALELARERMPVMQGPIAREEIFRASEMLLFGSAPLCVAITHFDGIPIGRGEFRGRPGPIARWLRDALHRRLLDTGTPF